MIFLFTLLHRRVQFERLLHLLNTYSGVSTWTSRLAMWPGRYGHAALALDNDRALVCGGNAPSTVVNTCVIYIASADTWTNASAMAQVRYGFNLVMLDGMWHWYCKNKDICRPNPSIWKYEYPNEYDWSVQHDWRGDIIAIYNGHGRLLCGCRSNSFILLCVHHFAGATYNLFTPRTTFGMAHYVTGGVKIGHKLATVLFPNNALNNGTTVVNIIDCAEFQQIYVLYDILVQ